MALAGAKKPPLQKKRPGMDVRPGGPRKPGDQSIEANLKQVLAESESKESTDVIRGPADDMAENDAPLVRLVNSLLLEAVKQNASDVHIEPFEGLLRVRFRIDGVLQEIQKIPHKLTPAIVSRLKIMAGLDICEKRIPQDGSIRFRLDDVEADLRLSTLPSVHGEKCVMRVMGKTDLNNDLSKVGIPPAQLKILRTAINKPNGLVLVTGPTGSGKTTTLYAALNEVNDISVSVFTAEDPVEGTIPGVTQCQVNTSVGFSFASILRSFLRQDPDVILVGEIRDQETAEIAIKASLTGHLVLSTLHTNCAVSTISRLIDIGLAPYLLTSSINCIVAQRLVRRICSECKEERPVSKEILESMGLDPEVLQGGQTFFGKGCKECHGSGYKGRAPIYEMLTLSDELRRMVLLGASKTELTLQARSEGMQTLRESGIELVKKGVTTLEEVLGVTNDDSDVASAESALANPIKMQTSTPAQTTVITAPDQNHTAVKDQATATNHTDSANVSPAEESAVKGSVDSDEVKEKARQAALRWKMLKESREGSKEEDPAPAT